MKFNPNRSGRLLGILIFFGALLLTLLLGQVNYFIGFEVSFSIFYWIPIFVSIWFLGWMPATLISIISASFWLRADLSDGHIYSQPLIPIWNTLMRFLMFQVVIFISMRLKQEIKIEKDLAGKDSITGIYNSRYLTKALEAEISRSLRLKHTLTLAYIDVDHFKRANDDFGHDQGDLLLTAIAGALQRGIRRYDVPARIGGDEFVVLFPETDEKQADVILSKLMKTLKAEIEKKAPYIGFSIGAAVYPHPLCAARDVIKKADTLMYEVKKSGKNNYKSEVVNL